MLLPHKSFMSTPTFHTSLTNLLLTCWSAKNGQHIIGTPATMLSNVEFHPLWVKKHPTDGCARTSSYGAHATRHPLSLAAVSSSDGAVSPPASTMSGLITHRNGRPLSTSPCQNSTSASLDTTVTLPKLT